MNSYCQCEGRLQSLIKRAVIQLYTVCERSPPLIGPTNMTFTCCTLCLGNEYAEPAKLM